LFLLVVLPIGISRFYSDLPTTQTVDPERQLDSSVMPKLEEDEEVLTLEEPSSFALGFILILGVGILLIVIARGLLWIIKRKMLG
jgi:hypothetical protein